MQIIIRLPFPDPALSPNKRIFRIKLAQIKKKERANAKIATLRALPLDYALPNFKDFPKVHVWIDFFPPDKRRRDLDNLIASFKCYQDGIADGLQINDWRFVPTYEFHDELPDPEKKGFVVFKVVI